MQPMQPMQPIQLNMDVLRQIILCDLEIIPVAVCREFYEAFRPTCGGVLRCEYASCCRRCPWVLERFTVVLYRAHGRTRFESWEYCVSRPGDSLVISGESQSWNREKLRWLLDRLCAGTHEAIEVYDGEWGGFIKFRRAMGKLHLFTK
jgi:hypothetical protein